MFELSKKSEKKLLLGSITGFWLLFWLSRMVNAFASGAPGWPGPDSFERYKTFFAAIGFAQVEIPLAVFAVVVFVEAVILFLLTTSVLSLKHDDRAHARYTFTWATILGMGLFTVFFVGGSLVLARGQAIEFTLYWLGLVVSWAIYDRAEG